MPPTATAARIVLERRYNGPPAGRPGDWPETFDACYVCAPARTDGLGVVFGPLPSDPALTGAVLQAGPGVPQRDGVLEDEIVWAALDCPSYTPPI